jgi:predicted ATP-grasp superfamily ATP-dependent carboligase
VSYLRVPAGHREPGVFDAFILDGATRQSLACVRSLGAAGLRLAVGEHAGDCGAGGDALAFRSRYCAATVVLPDIEADVYAFGEAVVGFVRQHPARMVLPTGDGAIGAMRPWRDELASLGCVLALASEPALDVAGDKDKTLAIAAELGIAFPRTMLIERPDQIDDVLTAFEFPFVLKPTASWTPQAEGRLVPAEVINPGEAAAMIGRCLAAGTACLAQEFAGGTREGVTMFVEAGEVRASCAHVAHRTVPALGGASVMRQSIPLPPDIYEFAVRLVKAIGLEGVCEVEFRRDRLGRPLLMEINARLAGTIENAVRSGVDFPLLIWQWASGQPVARTEGYRTGVRTRWLRGDMRWLRNNHGRVGRPDSVSRARALTIFAAEFARTRYYDCLDVRDLGPARAELRLTMAGMRNARRARAR